MSNPKRSRLKIREVRERPTNSPRICKKEAPNKLANKLKLKREAFIFEVEKKLRTGFWCPFGEALIVSSCCNGLLLFGQLRHWQNKILGRVEQSGRKERPKIASLPIQHSSSSRQQKSLQKGQPTAVRGPLALFVRQSCPDSLGFRYHRVHSATGLIHFFIS